MRETIVNKDPKTTAVSIHILNAVMFVHISSGSFAWFVGGGMAKRTFLCLW